MTSRGTVAIALLPLVFAALLTPPASARQGSPGKKAGDFIHQVSATRIADPKLDGARIDLAYQLDGPGATYQVSVRVLEKATGNHVALVFLDSEHGSTTPRHRVWDGRDDAGRFVDPGSYVVRVEATDARRIRREVDCDLDVVRLGIRSIEAESSATTTNEWQTVYFMKNGKYAFYATPATWEYMSKADTLAGDVSDLDLNDGSPRPATPVHTQTDEPAIEPNSTGGTRYEDDAYNYPLCYLVGSTPQFKVKFGDNCTLADGTLGTCNYPVAGYEIRCVATDEAGKWTADKTNILPDGIATLTGPVLPADATRTERHLEWRYQFRATGTTAWTNVPGTFATTHRIYTILDRPYFAAGGTGTQYSGPWVEVLDYAYTFSTALGITCDNSDRFVEAFMKGFFGQQGTLTTAIEGVHYDCPSEGGFGGATHYGGTGTVRLSHLLNNHDDGIYVNCTDCATTTSVMLSMMGISNVKLDHLGSMTLRAIWGIGCADYTLDLWSNGGGSGHGFSYHHIITRDDGVHISDACLCVDEDGNPDKLPGMPGYNTDRDWSNYESLLAHGTVTWFTEKLPKIN